MLKTFFTFFISLENHVFPFLYLYVFDNVFVFAIIFTTHIIILILDITFNYYIK